MGYLVSQRLSLLCSASCTVCVCFALYNLQSHKYPFTSEGRGERFRAVWSALWLGTKWGFPVFSSAAGSTGLSSTDHTRNAKALRAGCFDVNLRNCFSPLKCKPNGKAIAPVTALLLPLIWHIQCKCMLESDYQNALRSKGRGKSYSYLPELLC